MYSLKIEKYNKKIIELTGNESVYQIINIEGLNPPRALINLSPIAGNDGKVLNSTNLEPRNIVITIKINGDVEFNRLNLYNCFRTKEQCKIYYKNNNRNVYIEGIVENVECNYFTNNEIAQISIICPDPYFKDLETIYNNISKIISNFTFPFSINVDNPVSFSELDINRVVNIVNSSESESDLIININFLGNVEKLEIRNILTGKYIIINYSFIKGDILKINCQNANRSVILTRNGITLNLISNLKKGSKFIRLNIGDNQFSYLADDGENDSLVHIQFIHCNLYRGV